MASELKVNKISPESGTTLTLGDSGDTINFGSGVLPNFENLTVTGDLTVDTNSLKVDSTNNFVGIGTATPSVALDVVGAITATGNITGTLATAAQPNITSVGTLSSLSVSGNITGTLATAAQPNITSLGTLTGLTTTGNINLGDNDKINLGATPTLELYSDGTNSWIKESGTGGLYIGGTNLNIMDSTFAESIITGTTNGAVTLFYDNNAKLATTSTGVSVTGTLSTTDLVSSTNGLTFVGNSGTPSAGAFLHRPSANTLVLGTASTEAMRIDSSGNIKIGDATTDVTSKLTVSGNGANELATFMHDGSAGTYFDINCNSANGTVVLRADARTGAYPPLTFTTGGSERMRLTSDGYLGIGTTTPSTLIDLAAGATGTAGGSIAGITMTNRYDSPDNSYSIKPNRPGVSNTGLAIRDETDGRTDMVFDGTGKVGIGTSSPVAPLHAYNATSNEIARFQSGDEYVHIVFQDSTTTNTPYIGAQGNIFRIITGGAERMRILSNGYVGIGTSSPTSNLYIQSSSNAVDALHVRGAGGNNFIHCTGNQGNTAFTVSEIGGADPCVVKLYNTGVETIILTTNPTETTVFNERGDNVDFRIESDTNTHAFFVDASTNRVGILNSSPTQALDVTGTVKATAFQGDGSALTNLPAAGETAFAYVNFNGTGTVSIRGSYNVSSITDHQTGDYSVNFSSSASNSTYTAVGTGGDPGQDGEPFWTQAISTSAWRGWLKVPNAGRNDRPYVMATIHGG